MGGANDLDTSCRRLEGGCDDRGGRTESVAGGVDALGEIGGGSGSGLLRPVSCSACATAHYSGRRQWRAAWANLWVRRWIDQDSRGERDGSEGVGERLDADARDGAPVISVDGRRASLD